MEWRLAASCSQLPNTVARVSDQPRKISGQWGRKLHARLRCRVWCVLTKHFRGLNSKLHFVIIRGENGVNGGRSICKGEGEDSKRIEKKMFLKVTSSSYSSLSLVISVWLPAQADASA